MSPGVLIKRWGSIDADTVSNSNLKMTGFANDGFLTVPKSVIFEVLLYDKMRNANSRIATECALSPSFCQDLDVYSAVSTSIFDEKQ